MISSHLQTQQNYIIETTNTIMGFKSDAEKLRVKAKIRRDEEISQGLVIREPSDKKGEDFEELVRLSKAARLTDSRFTPFNEPPGMGIERTIPLNETNHAILISERETGFQGYLTFVDSVNMNSIWPFPAELQHPKIISEFKQGWFELEWSRKYDITNEKIIQKDWCILNQIWIEEECRGRGLARILLDKFFEHCKSNNLLAVVDQPNSDFKKFSSHVGKIEGKSWVHYVSNLIVPIKQHWKGNSPSEDDLNSTMKLIEWAYNDGNIPGFIPPGI